MSSPITFTITFRGASHPFTLLPSTLLSTLLEDITQLTTVPPSLQKLLIKGRSLTLVSSGSQTLQEAGIKHGLKLMLMGSTEEQLEGLKGGEAARASEQAERRQRERVTRERKTGSVRSTGKASIADATVQYRFHALEPLAHLPNPASALQLLEKLSADPGVQHLLSTHKFSIGLLTELAPHEHPELLGLNQNKGEIIKLRLRTDAYDGFRLYADVRRVLVHELTHCVWGDHDDNVRSFSVFWTVEQRLIGGTVQSAQLANEPRALIVRALSRAERTFSHQRRRLRAHCAQGRSAGGGGGAQAEDIGGGSKAGTEGGGGIGGEVRECGEVEGVAPPACVM
ncbi:WLM-domain-containing protein [Calocera viscosa TUFC12733]|uniref:WLM-domain-containing protein n=1 Tax=Calocera viscosa (strain TUFC12733) TaxID=1330018 RepID=A0A167IAG7_CALVF|nr:WLM-domain-containing protein [Calocera viscosa TUFC12733]